MTTLTKDTRVDFRLAAEHKSLLEQAARLSGLSLSDFILSASVKAANGVMEQQRRIVVSEQEYERFLAALEVDTPPTEAAQRAAERFKEVQVTADGTHTWTSAD